MQSVSRNYSMDEFLRMSGYIESAAYDMDKLSFLFLGRLKGKNSDDHRDRECRSLHKIFI